MELRLHFDFDRAALNDLILIRQMAGIKENGAGTFIMNYAEEIRDLVARMSVDAEGSAIPFEAAQKFAGNMSLVELRRVLEGMGEKVREIEDKVISPANGNGSL